MNPGRSLPLALVLIAASLAAHGAPSMLAQTNGAAGTPAAPRTDPTVTPMPQKPQAGTPPVIQPPSGAPAPKRREQTGGERPDAMPVDPGAAGHIDESTGPTSGARARPPEDESKRTLPTGQGDKDKPGVSTPPESIR